MSRCIQLIQPRPPGFPAFVHRPWPDPRRSPSLRPCCGATNSALRTRKTSCLNRLIPTCVYPCISLDYFLWRAANYVPPSPPLTGGTLRLQDHEEAHKRDSVSCQAPSLTAGPGSHYASAPWLLAISPVRRPESRKLKAGLRPYDGVRDMYPRCRLRRPTLAHRKQ